MNEKEKKILGSIFSREKETNLEREDDLMSLEEKISEMELAPNEVKRLKKTLSNKKSKNKTSLTKIIKNIKQKLNTHYIYVFILLKINRILKKLNFKLECWIGKVQLLILYNEPYYPNKKYKSLKSIKKHNEMLFKKMNSVKDSLREIRQNY